MQINNNFTIFQGPRFCSAYQSIFITYKLQYFTDLFCSQGNINICMSALDIFHQKKNKVFKEKMHDIVIYKIWRLFTFYKKLFVRLIKHLDFGI